MDTSKIIFEVESDLELNDGMTVTRLANGQVNFHVGYSSHTLTISEVMDLIRVLDGVNANVS